MFLDCDPFLLYPLSKYETWLYLTTFYQLLYVHQFCLPNSSLLSKEVFINPDSLESIPISEEEPRLFKWTAMFVKLGGKPPSASKGDNFFSKSILFK